MAAVTNALDLMGDAAALLSAGSPRRAYALGVIAVEEAAKSLRCREILQDWPATITVAQLNKKLKPATNAHVRRYLQTLAYIGALNPAAPLPPGFDDLEAMAKSDMRARERVLYVEVAPSGAPVTPAGVSEAEASSWVSAMVSLFAGLGNAWYGGLNDALAEAGDEPV
jgi:AbiV family abortive infection protein